MAYDGSSLYGDIICDDFYDTQNNLMNPPSDVGFFFYKIIGGAFDRMSEICSNFLNDCDVLTCVLVNREYRASVSDFKSKEADTDYVVTTDYESFDHYRYDKSSDSFVFVETTDNAFITRTKLDTRWGKEYDLPRPTLPIPYSLIFNDDGVRRSKNSNWYIRSTDASSLSVTVDDEGTTLSSNDTSSSRFYFANPEHSTSTSPPITLSDFVIECDVISTNFGSGSQIAFLLQGLGTNFNLSSYTAPYHIKMEKTGTTVKQYINDTLIRTTTISNRTNYYMGFQLYKNCSIKFKNYRIYDTSTPSERPLTDDEYRVYLYMNLCRLLTLQDIRIVSERCFNTENDSVTITKVPSGIFQLTDMLTDNQSIAGVTDYLTNDSEVHLTDMLSRNVATFTQINIPAQGWDSNFLALVKEFASLKGNVLIQEVTG